MTAKGCSWHENNLGTSTCQNLPHRMVSRRLNKHTTYLTATALQLVQFTKKGETLVVHSLLEPTFRRLPRLFHSPHVAVMTLSANGKRTHAFST